MALPYSVRFIGRQGVTTNVRYLVPAGKRAIVVDVSLFIGVSGGGGEVTFKNATVGNTIAWWLEEGIVQVYEHWVGRAVFNEGEEIEINTSTPSMPVDACVSGYLLSA